MEPAEKEDWPLNARLENATEARAVPARSGWHAAFVSAATGDRSRSVSRAAPGLWVVALVACFSGCVLWASDGYLARKGPPALRFEPPRSTKADFAWPVPLSRTNSSGALSSSFPPVSQSSTNSDTQTSTSPAPLTDASTAEALGPVLPTAIGPGFEPFGAETNAFSASNLLNITPQMLADYFKATLDNSYRVSTNALNGAEIPFNPPLPFAKPSPSSEATYRVQ